VWVDAACPSSPEQSHAVVAWVEHQPVLMAQRKMTASAALAQRKVRHPSQALHRASLAHHLSPLVWVWAVWAAAAAAAAAVAAQPRAHRREEVVVAHYPYYLPLVVREHQKVGVVEVLAALLHPHPQHQHRRRRRHHHHLLLLLLLRRRRQEQRHWVLWVQQVHGKLDSFAVARANFAGTRGESSGHMATSWPSPPFLTMPHEEEEEEAVARRRHPPAAADGLGGSSNHARPSPRGR